MCAGNHSRRAAQQPAYLVKGGHSIAGGCACEQSQAARGGTRQVVLLHRSQVQGWVAGWVCMRQAALFSTEPSSPTQGLSQPAGRCSRSRTCVRELRHQVEQHFARGVHGGCCRLAILALRSLGSGAPVVRIAVQAWHECRAVTWRTSPASTSCVAWQTACRLAHDLVRGHRTVGPSPSLQPAAPSPPTHPSHLKSSLSRGT